MVTACLQVAMTPELFEHQIPSRAGGFDGAHDDH
jgi:hypothetical protein